MSVFAVTDQNNLIEAINYALSNLGQATGNGSVSGNTLVVNTTTGVISQSGSTTVISYLYQYINIAYADSSDGGTNFSINRFDNAQYYGVLNNALANPGSTILNNPANYIWYKVTGGFGTTKYLFYSVYGGQQIQFTAATSVPPGGFVQASDGVAIDLQFVTAAASLPIVIATAFYNSANANVAPSTPTGGTYDFGNLILTPPAGWSNSVPANNTSFFSSQNTFKATSSGNVTVGPSDPWTVPVLTGKLGTDGANGANGTNGTNGTNGVSTYFYNVFQSANSAPSVPSGGYWNFGTTTGTPPAGWSNTPTSPLGDPIWATSATVASNVANANVSIGNSWSSTFQYTGAGGAAGERGPIPMAYVVTPTTPLTANSSSLSQWFQAPTNGTPAGSNTAPIGTGLIPVDQDTASFTLTSNTAVSKVYTYNSGNSTWTPAFGQVLNGNVFVTGSINSNKLNANDVYALNISGGNAVVGNTSSGGFWLQASSGNARFGGNVSIGNSLTIQNNAVIGNSLTIGQNATIGGVTLNGSLLANVVTSTQLANGAVVVGKIGSGAVVSGTIGSNAVTAGTINTGAVTAGAIAVNAVTAGTIAVGAVTANTIAANAVTAGTIAAGAVTANTIAANAVTANNIAANSITATKISAGAVTAGTIAAGAVQANAITAGTMSGNIIIANTMAGNVIIANTLSGNAVIANTINGNAIIANTIAANTISAGTLNAGVIYAGNITSFGATQGNVSSPGYWLNYTSGNARFGGNVSIGANLNVTGLITTGALVSNTVATTTMQPNSVTLQGGVAYATVGTYATSPTAAQIYLVGDTYGIITCTQNNQSNFVWSQLQSTVNVTGLGAAENFSFENYLLRYDYPALTNETIIAYYAYTIQGIPTYTSSSPFTGFFDNDTVAGQSYLYIMGSAWYPGTGTYTVTNFIAGPRSIVIQSLKR